MTQLGERLVDATIDDFPGHLTDTRAAHAWGIGARGWFRASTPAREWCDAPPFRADSVPVLARFSNGSGGPTEHDADPDARGLAVKLSPGSEHELDLVAMTLPLFFVKDPDTFLEFSKASVPVKVRRAGWWARLKADLLLHLPPPPAPPRSPALSFAHLLKFTRSHPEAITAVAALGSLIRPTSYARAAYHGVHAFRLTGSSGVTRHARFTWHPEAGVRAIADDATPPPGDDYLRDELPRRLARGPVAFSLQLHLADGGDDVADPTTPWPTRRTRVTLGRLVLTSSVPTEEIQRASFNPGRTVGGWSVSDDRILLARREAYEVSCGRRGGSGCPVHAAG